MRLLVGIIASILLASAVVAQGLPQDVAEAYRDWFVAIGPIASICMPHVRQTIMPEA